MLVGELTAVLNRYNQEAASHTADFILASYLLACLDAFNRAVNRRELWYGRQTFGPTQMDTLPPEGPRPLVDEPNA